MEDLKHAIYTLESKFGKDIQLRRFYNAKALEAGGRHRKRKGSKTSTLARRMKECENDEHIDDCKSKAVCDLSRKGKHGLQAANKCCGRIAKANNGKWYRSMRKKNLKRPCRWIEIENPNRKTRSSISKWVKWNVRKRQLKNGTMNVSRMQYVFHLQLENMDSRVQISVAGRSYYHGRRSTVYPLEAHVNMVRVHAVGRRNHIMKSIQSTDFSHTGRVNP